MKKTGEILAAIIGPEPVEPELEHIDRAMAEAWWEDARKRLIIGFRTDDLVESVAVAIAKARRKAREAGGA